jgi:hypothetical protein
MPISNYLPQASLLSFVVRMFLGNLSTANEHEARKKKSGKKVEQGSFVESKT